MQTSLLSTGHASLITHLAYNFHGKRLATSSLDHSVRVTAPDSQFKAHDSPVLKVVWAHPEHGAVLATGAVDGVVKIWVEEPSRNASGTSKWVSKASLTEARGSIRDLEFAPPEAGLKLAVVSSDSHLRLWECLDPVTLADWSLVEDIDLSILPTTPSSSMDKGAAPGTSAEGQSAGGSPQKLNAPGSSLAGSSTGSGNSFDGRKTGTVESDGGWALSWCKESWWGEILTVSSGSSGIIRLFHLPDHAPWTNFLNLLPPRPASSYTSQPPPTCSLAWAPASGRSYQLLASGSRDGRARVWKVHTPSLEEGMGDTEWRGEMDAELDDNSASARGSVGSVKVDWNLSGTVLSTAGDDAKVRLWKSTYTGQWKTIALLTTDDKGDEEMGDK